VLDKSDKGGKLEVYRSLGTKL